MNRLQSYITSIKYIKNLISFKRQHPNVTAENQFYKGLNGSDVPMNVFSPKGKQKNIIFIIFPGASPKGENHEGMVTLGSILACIGYKCLIPRIPPLKDLDLLDNNSDWFSHAYKEITNRKDISDYKIAVIGMSFGGAILVKSLASGMCNGKKAKSALLYGAPYDNKTFINFLLTGEISIDGEIQKVKQHEWGIIVILHNFLNKINLGYDTSLMEKILKNKIAENESYVSENIKKLNPEQKEIIESAFNGIASKSIKKICTQIKNECNDLIDQISPKYFCKNVKEHTFIAHGANDTMVPYTESLLLSKNMTNNELFISYLYEHKEISSDKGIIFKIKEIFKMMNYFSKYFYYNEN